MASEPRVSARDVLAATEEVQCVGIERVLLEWERRERDLAEYRVERISTWHRRFTSPPGRSSDCAAEVGCLFWCCSPPYRRPAVERDRRGGASAEEPDEA